MTIIDTIKLSYRGGLEYATFTRSPNGLEVPTGYWTDDDGDALSSKLSTALDDVILAIREQERAHALLR